MSVTGGVNNGACDGISVGLSVGEAVKIGAKLDLSLPGPLAKFDETFKTVGPLTLNSKPDSLYSTCLDPA